jgi:hypothetical protein
MNLFEAGVLLLLAGNFGVGLLLLLRGGARRSAAELKARLAAISHRFEQRGAEFASAVVADAATFDSAVAKAAGFLRQRLRSGAYGLACTGPDGAARFSDNKGHVFVAHFIAEAMDGLLDEIDRTIILVRLMSEENGGLWGFSPPGAYHREEMRIFHVDSDDSAYVIRTLRRLGVNRSPERLLLFYRENDRLFTTFDAPGPTRLTTQPSPAHNLLAHPEVNMNIFLAIRGTHLEPLVHHEIVAEAQDERGLWPSYFYPSPLFGTLLALELLDGKSGFAVAAKRARAAIAAAQSADGSWGIGGDPYETALAVSALAGHRGHAAATRRGLEHLLATMAEDGSWTSPACIWEFHADAGDVWRAHDRQRSYVSARCLTALRRAAALGATP